MDLMNLDGAESMAFGAIAAKDGLDFPFDKVGGQGMSRVKYLGIGEALSVAKPLSGGGSAAEEDGRAAIATIRHK